MTRTIEKRSGKDQERRAQQLRQKKKGHGTKTERSKIWLLKRNKRAASDEKELVGNPYSSMDLAKEAAEVVQPIFEANIYGYHILWVCFLMSMCSVQHGLNYRISSCNFIADWMIDMGKIYIVGLALATSELAITDLPGRSHQPGRTSFFLKRSFGKKSVIPGFYQHSWFSKWL